ncbi:hypothetical protein L6452_03703 [Arctium lappa]|uniref:Uncharacterized protein n=1 Tax=Arctium lappa TaxID=4217 RepID=A0ACB9FMW2_ARCLA|nr:hypothetical protein L6452_03703 [Arctium lappa]
MNMNVSTSKNSRTLIPNCFCKVENREGEKGNRWCHASDFTYASLPYPDLADGGSCLVKEEDHILPKVGRRLGTTRGLFVCGDHMYIPIQDPERMKPKKGEIAEVGRPGTRR